MSRKQRVMVIGLDGVPLQLVQKWADAGYLPNLKTLMETGAVGNLLSTMPPTSGPSWSSFITGKQPGKNGIYDFLYRADGTYSFPPVSTLKRHGTSLWRLLNQGGKRVGILNVPVTYPTEEIQDFMITGFMTPYGTPDYAYPPAVLDELKAAMGHYTIYPTATFTEASADHFFKASHDLLDMRTKAARVLLENHDLDMFMVVFFDTDRILHQTWHWIDPTHPWRAKENPKQDKSGPVAEYFRHLDASIGKLLEYTDENTTVIILSDHGMGAAHRFVILNNWLAKVGLLKFKRDPFTWVKKMMYDAGFTLRNVHHIADLIGLAKHAEYKGQYRLDGLLKIAFLSFNNVDWSQTKAYSFGRHTGPVYVNLKGREPQGCVDPADYDAVCQEIETLVQDFHDPDTGESMIGRVLRKKDTYSGPFADQGPDLIMLPRKETDIFFGLADFGDNRIMAPVYRYSGMHRDYGMLVMNGRGVGQGRTLEGNGIWDMAPTILHLLGQEVPNDMDGKVIGDALVDFEPEQVRYRDVNASDQLASGESAYSEDDEEDINERLRSLGYL